MQLSDFKTYVRRDFKRTDKDTEIVRALNDMQIWVAVNMPHGSYKYQSYITLVDAQEDYPLPSTLIHLMHPVRLLDGSASSDTGAPLEHITKEEYDVREPNPNRSSPSTKGSPTAYCVYGRSLLLIPIPDAGGYLLEINWTKRPIDLSADADVPALGGEWTEILKYGVLERVNEGMELYNEAKYWGEKYHRIDAFGNDVPVGMCKRLFDIETDREFSAITRVTPNGLF